MPRIDVCPDVATLRRLLHGQLAEEEAQPLEQHLMECRACLQAVRVMPLDDTIIRAMREQPTLSDASGPEEAVRKLMERLKLLPLCGHEATAEIAAAEAQPSAEPRPLGSAPQMTQEAHGFLAPPEKPGEIGRLGPYRVLKVLGAGGMGVVFQAEDVKLKRLVALKAMRPGTAASAGAGQRFQREAETTAAIKHDHIVTIYQVGEDRGVPFLAMEFLDGESLDDRLQRDNTLPLAESLRISREIAEGLAAAHEHGLIHRDIKPGNLWLEGKRGRVKILDFGLARAAGDDMHLTQSGAIVGTPAYMSPEQARSEALDHRCDLFSLGCVMYRMATGVLPFQGKDTMSMLLALAMEHPRPPRELNLRLPPALNNLILRLLAKNVADRPASALAVAKAIERIESTPVSSQISATVRDERPAAQREAVTKRKKRTLVLAAPRRRRGLFVAAALIGLLGAAAAAAVIVIRLRTPDGKEINIEAPEGTTVTIAVKEERPKAVKEEKPKPPPPPVVPVVPPLDRLDPKDIPAAERFDWQPKELVAVLGEHRLRHWSGNVSVVFSPDGKTLASYGQWDKELCLWDAASGEKLLGLTLEGEFVSVVFSPDGRRLVALGHDQSGGQNLVLAEWEPTTGKLLSKQGLDTPATLLTRDEQGRFLVLGCPDGSVRLLDAQTKKERKVLRGHKGAITWLALNRTGSVLATSGADNITKIWDFEKGEERITLKHQDIGMTPRAINPGGGIIAGRSKDGVALWNLDKKQRQVVYKLPEWTAPEQERMTFDREGRTLVIGDSHGHVHLYKIGQNKDGVISSPKIELRGAEGPIWSLCYSPNEHVLAVAAWSGPGGDPGVVRLWKIATEEKTLPAERGGMGAQSLAAIPNSQTVVSVEAEGAVTFWDLAAGKETRSLKWDALCLARAPDGKTMATGSRDGNVRVWDVATGKETGTLGKHRLGVVAIAYAPDGKTIASGSADGAVLVWDASPRKERFKLASQGMGVSSIAYAPDGKTFAVGRADGRITIHEAGTGKERQSMRDQGSPVLLAWTPDSRSLVSCAKEVSGIRVWDVEAGQQKFLLGETGPVRSLAFAPDGTRFVTSMEDGTVKFWEWTAYREPVIWHAHPKPITAITFSADGRQIVAGSSDGTLILGDGKLGEELAPTRGHTASVTLLAFSPDGRTLTSGSRDDSSAREWDVASGKETRVHRHWWFDLAPRDLSRDGRIVAWAGVENRPNAGLTWVPAIIHDLQTGKAPWLRPSGRAPLSVVRTPDGRTLAQVGIDLWDADTGKKVDRFYKAAVVPEDPQATQKDLDQQFNATGDHIRGVQLSPDGRLLAVVSDNGVAKVWDVRAAKELWTAKGQEGNHPMFTPDGQTLAIYNDNTHRMKLYKADTGAEQQTVPLLEISYVGASLAFAPDGKRFAWSGGGRVFVGELPSGRKLREWTLATWVSGLAFASDGRHLALGNNNGTIYILRLEAAKPGP